MSEHRKRTTRVELREDLRRVLAPRRELRDSVKTSVLAYAAKRRATPSRRRRVIPMPRRIAAAAAIAAAVALLLIAPWRTHSPRTTPGDLNRDGRSDILDAYLLAHSIEAGSPLDAAADLDGDGAVDERDLRSLMEDIVRLDGGSS